VACPPSWFTVVGRSTAAPHVRTIHKSRTNRFWGRPSVCSDEGRKGKRLDPRATPPSHFTISVKEIGGSCSIFVAPAAVAVGVTISVYVPAGVTNGATGGGAGLCCAVLGVLPTPPHPAIHRIIPARYAFSGRIRDPLAATPIMQMQSANIASTPQRATIPFHHCSLSPNNLPAILPEEVLPKEVVSAEAAAAAAAPEVVTLTVKFATAPFVTLTELGALQLAPVGAPVHAKAKVPLNPVPPVACRLNCAVCPAVTVTLVLPPIATWIITAGAALPVSVRL